MILCCLYAHSLHALEVYDIDLAQNGKAELLEIKLDKPVKSKSFILSNPPRLVIDLPPFNWNVSSNASLISASRILSGIRYARFDEFTSRIVIDFNQPVAFKSLSEGASQSLRFQLEGALGDGKISAENGWANQNDKNRPRTMIFEDNTLPTSKARAASEQDKPLIVIDAGHGGKDSGALGGQNTKEKNVTLAYARALRDALKQTGKYRAELTRDSDKIIILRERFRIARKLKADLFISLHADSAPNPNARGLSVYTLSETASDKEAAALAQQENRVDVLADVDLLHENVEVAGILIDLARRETKNKSVKLAEQVVQSARGGVDVLNNPHRHAGFAVLKAPDIPSVLVEIGFLTNMEEEKRINSASHQAKVIKSLVQAITNYFEHKRQ